MECGVSYTKKSNAKETGKDHTVGDTWDELKKAKMCSK